tara:strand:- start:4040 stop:4240 length:201 start_codon:yes stop_codon:yes gene_type:complete
VWQSGHAADCKSANAGSIPASLSKSKTIGEQNVQDRQGRRNAAKIPKWKRFSETGQRNTFSNVGWG